jgi:hypothetical protein
MGLWAKMMQVKDSAEAVKAVVLPQPTPDRVLDVSGTKGVFVVGGEYVAKDSQKVPTASGFTVELRREPTNTHDKNAIMVLYRGRKIGYFSAGNAADYAPLIDIAIKSGQAVQATATAQKTNHGDVNTTVEMPTVYELAVQLGPAASRIADANKPPIQATLKQLSEYQDKLSLVLAGMEQREIKATVVVGATPAGKYKGQNMVTFYFQGEEIGVLPAQYRDTHREFFRAAESGKTTCMVLIRRYDERLWARATMY